MKVQKKIKIINLFSKLNNPTLTDKMPIFLQMSELISIERSKQFRILKKLNKIRLSDNIVKSYYHNLLHSEIKFMYTISNNNQQLQFTNLPVHNEQNVDEVEKCIKQNISAFENLYITGDIIFSQHSRSKLIKHFSRFGIILVNNSYSSGNYSKRYITNFQPFRQNNIKYLSVTPSLLKRSTKLINKGKTSILSNSYKNVRKYVRHHRNVLMNSYVDIDDTIKYNLINQFNINSILQTNSSNIKIVEDRLYDEITKLTPIESNHIKIGDKQTLTIDITACLPSFMQRELNTHKDMYMYYVNLLNSTGKCKYKITRDEIKQAFIVLINGTKWQDWKTIDYIKGHTNIYKYIRHVMSNAFSNMISDINIGDNNLRQYLYAQEAKFIRYDLFNFAYNNKKLKDMNILQKHDELIVQLSKPTIKLLRDYLKYQEANYYWLNFKINDETNYSYATTIIALDKLLEVL